MRNQPSPDDAIDQALAALRNARPAEGLESRILASLRHPEPLHRPTHRWLPVALTLATASLLVAALLLRTPTPPGSLALTHLPNPKPSARAREISPLFVSRRRPLLPRPPALPRRAPAQLTSFPAPPAPLTEQEKVLLQIVHRGDQDTFNLLNPEATARELAQNMAAFDRFFPPPAPFGPPAPQPSIQNPNLETANDAHTMDR